MSINKLYNQARNGNKGAERLLFEKLRERFMFITQRRIMDTQDVEEVVQDSLMIIVGKSKDIDFNVSFAAWARKVLENNILNYYRKTAQSRKKLNSYAIHQNHVTGLNSRPDLKRRLLDCLMKLCESNIRHARILNYAHQGYTIEHICEKLNISKNAAYVMLSRARKALKNCLEKGLVKP